MEAATSAAQTVRVVNGHPSRVQQREAGSHTAGDDGIALL